MHTAGTALPSAVPAFDLRISIVGTDPEIWRRLLLPKTITIPEFHVAVQCAFGWEDRHLYGIRCLDRNGHPRVIVGPDEAAEGIDAEPASGVGLFELIGAQGTRPADFEYEYDFGDTWTHTVKLVGSGLVPEGTITCEEGANRGPVEDSGGPGGYRRLVEVLSDEKHPEFYDAATWFSEVTGERARAFDVGAFDLDAVNRSLGRLSLQLWPRPLTPTERDSVLRPIMWFLNSSAGEGLELTKNGFLKPAMVRRSLDELGWHDEIMGKGNRELNSKDVLNLRLHLLDWKLLLKRNGRMVLGPMGKIALDDPDALWDYMVRTIGAPQNDALKLMTRLAAHWLVQGIAPSYTLRGEAILTALEATGFVNRSGDPIPESWAWDIDRKVQESLDCLQLTVPAPRFLLAEKDLTDGGLKFLLQVQELLGDR